MPTRNRPYRTLPALFLVAALVAAASPITAARPASIAPVDLTPDREAPALSVAARPAELPAYDFGPSLRGVITGRPVAVPAVVAAPAVVAPRERAVPADWTSRPAVAVPEPTARTARVGEPEPAAGAAEYSGRNRVWIPALGISRSISFFSCSSNAYPGDRVYRWGCAGSNNVYLFGHAHSVFKPLHDAYVRGRLAKGMRVIYADGNGRIHTYAVRWWKVTTPENGAFAFAAQSKPSLTLQTCVGARSENRLIVRLTKVG